MRKIHECCKKFYESKYISSIPNEFGFHFYEDPNTVINEYKTVLWNREEVKRRNEEYIKEKNRLDEIKNDNIKDLKAELYGAVLEYVVIPVNLISQIIDYVDSIDTIIYSGDDYADQFEKIITFIKIALDSSN